MAQFQQTARAEISNQISFTVSEQQYLDAMLLHAKTKRMLLPAILTVLALGATSAMSSVSFALGLMLSLTAYFALLTLVFRWSFRQGVKRQYLSMPQMQGVQTVQFSEEGLALHNDYMLSRVKWMIYQKYDVNESMYLLYQGPGLFNVIPRSAFADAEQEAVFRNLLELHVKPAAKASLRRPRREI